MKPCVRILLTTSIFSFIVGCGTPKGTLIIKLQDGTSKASLDGVKVKWTEHEWKMFGKSTHLQPAEPILETNGAVVLTPFNVRRQNGILLRKPGYREASVLYLADGRQFLIQSPSETNVSTALYWNSTAHGTNVILVPLYRQSAN